MSKDLTKNLGELNGSVKSYVQAKIDLVKLRFLEKTTRFTSYLFTFLVVLMFLMLVIGFAATAFAVWYGETYNNYVAGLLIAGGVLILLAFIFILFRKQIVTTSVLKNFSEILFEDDDEEKQN
ncbi:phage holin family protein [Mariniphaga sp.]|uniref:phage holin family protein n=1 Tax=Mariniphaga sp. TaxID=1954475 RepID=UPI00356B2D40